MWQRNICFSGLARNIYFSETQETVFESKFEIRVIWKTKKKDVEVEFHTQEVLQDRGVHYSSERSRYVSPHRQGGHRSSHRCTRGNGCCRCVACVPLCQELPSAKGVLATPFFSGLQATGALPSTLGPTF
jgi:hypothetical protein